MFSNGCDVNYNDTWTYYLDLEASFQKGAEELKAVGGCTALHIGAVQGEYSLVEALLQVEGVQVDPQDNYGVTPLYDAASFGYDGIIKLLAAAGADVDLPSHQGVTPLQETFKVGQLVGLSLTYYQSSYPSLLD